MLLFWLGLAGQTAAVAQDPVANDISFTVNNQGDSYLYVLLNDEEGTNPIDPSSIDIVLEPEHGDLELMLEDTFTPPGVLKYTYTSTTTETSDSFTYTVRDKEGNESNTATVTIDIIDNDLGFTTFNDTKFFGEGISPKLDLTEFVVYQGGIDVGTIELLRFNNTDGNQSLDEDGILTYQHPSPLPDPEDFRLEFSYTVQSVDGTYSPPVSLILTFSELLNASFEVDAGVEAELDILEHYRALNGGDVTELDDYPIDEQSVTILEGPSKGTAVADETDAYLIQYTAGPGEAGSDEFLVQGVNSGVPVLLFRVQLDINSRPSFTSTPVLSAQEGEPYQYQVEASDPDGDPFMLTAPGLPGWLTFTDTGSGTGMLEGTPTASDIGNNEVILQAEAGVHSVTQEFTIEVIAANEPPVFTSTFDEETVVEGEEFTFQFEADDADGDVLNFMLISGGGTENVSLTTDGLFSFTPDVGQAGGYNFTVQVSDGELTVDHDFTMIVQEEPNEPPVFTSTFDEETVVEGEEFTFQFEADDADGDNLSFTLISGGGTGNVSLTPDGLFSFTPDVGQAGEYNFTIHVSDGEFIDERDFVVIVQEEPNEPPVFSSTPITIVQMDELYQYEVETSDPDGDQLTITAPGLPGWLDFSDNGDGTGLLEGTPSASDLGEHTVQLQVSDGGEAAMQEFAIEVREEPNEPPVFTTTVEEETVVEGEEFTFQFEAEDPDGDDLTYSLTAGGDVKNSSITTDGLFSFFSEAGQAGSYDFTVQVNDGELTSEHTFTVFVEEAPNNLPVFTATFDEDQVLEGQLLTFQFEADDPDGDELTYTLSFGSETDNAGITESGLFTFSPDTGRAGEYDFTVEVSDGELTADHNFTVVVLEEPNEAPVFTTAFEEETVVEEEEFLFQFEADDPDGDDLTFTLTSGGDVENVSMTSDGLFGFAPELGQAEVYNFTVEVSDGEMTADHSFVVIVEEPPNEPPVFTATFEQQTIVEGEEFTFQFEAEDQAGDTLTYTLTEGADVENIALIEEGLFTFVPNFEQAGEYNFAVEVSDRELSATHSFTIVVEEGNRPPEARNITAPTRMNLQVTIELTEFVSDPDEDPLEITGVSTPQHGQASLDESTGVVSYIPAINFTGTDSFEYTVTDDDGAADTGLVTVEVLGLAFRVVDLGLPDGAVSRAFDISDEGHVAGIISEGSGSTTAFLWAGGELELISGLNQVFGVNDSGNLAGMAEEAGTVLPAMFLNGSVVRGTAMGGNFGALYDINNSDVSVGVVDNANGVITGFLWDENGQQSVGSGDDDLQLFSINDEGTMVGFSQSVNGEEQAVRVQPGGTVQILSSGSGTGSRAFGAGNGGQVVGVIHNGSTFGGAVWQNGSMQELPGLGESPTIAYGVNNGGVIVGASGEGEKQKRVVNSDILDRLAGITATTDARRGKRITGGKSELQSTAQLANEEGLRAVMWIENEVIDMNGLIPSGSGWELIEARAVNNYMDIVGYGRLNGEVRAFLLSPEDTEPPIAETVVQNVTGKDETVVDLLPQLKNTYGETIITELWGGTHGIIDLREGRYLHYRVNHNAIAEADTVYYRAVDQRGAIAEGEIIFAIENLPDSFELSQNYPNPFNSSTVIPFQLAEYGRVEVELYSIDGRRIGVLMDQNLPRGAHLAKLGNMNLASGIYFYRIRVTNASGNPVFSEIRKMSLVK